MSAFVGPLVVAPVGSTGNNTHTGVGLHPGADKTALAFKIEATGAGPTVTFKLQGSMDGSTWFDLILLPADNETAAITATKTATGTYAYFVAQAPTRFAKYARVVTSSNTNVTYSAAIYQQLGR